MTNVANFHFLALLQETSSCLSFLFELKLEQTNLTQKSCSTLMYIIMRGKNK